MRFSHKGREGNTMSERVRQIELVRLKREAKRAKLEDKFSYAAVTVGLAERQHILLTERCVTLFALKQL